MKTVAKILIFFILSVALVAFETWIARILIGDLFPQFGFLDTFKIILVAQMVVGSAAQQVNSNRPI